MTLLLLSALGVVGAMLCVTRGRVTAFYVTLTFELFFLIGLLRYADIGLARSETVDRFGLGVLGLVCGYAAVHMATHRSQDPGMDEALESPRASIEPVHLVIPLAGILLLTTYHFAVVGLPILSENVELDRWRFTDSGLLGLPSRAYLLGLPLLSIISFQTARRRPGDRFARTLMAVAVGATLVTRLVGGFKGEVLDLILLVFIVSASARGGARVGSVAKVYVPLVAAALVFAALVSTLYGSARSGSGEGTASPAATVYDRMTIGAVRPAILVMEARSSGQYLMSGDTVANDFIAHGTRYLGSSTSRYDFKSVVSATMNGRSLDQARERSVRTFVVPVTVGFVAVAFYNYGVIAIGVLALLGALFAWLERRVERGGPQAELWAATGLVVLHQAIHKGDIAFQAINWFAVLAVISAGFWASQKLLNPTEQR